MRCTSHDLTTPLTWGFAAWTAGGNLKFSNPRPSTNHQVSDCEYGGGREKGVRGEHRSLDRRTSLRDRDERSRRNRLAQWRASICGTVVLLRVSFSRMTQAVMKERSVRLQTVREELQDG